MKHHPAAAGKSSHAPAWWHGIIFFLAMMMGRNLRHPKSPKDQSSLRHPRNPKHPKSPKDQSNLRHPMNPKHPIVFKFADRIQKNECGILSRAAAFRNL